MIIRLLIIILFGVLINIHPSSGEEDLIIRPVGGEEEIVWGEDKDNYNYKREGGSTADLDANGRYIGDFNQDCGETTTITKSRKTTSIELEDDMLKSPNTKCHWNIIGADECLPTLTCKKFKLANSTGKNEDKCKEEYLEVTDGVSGYEKYCGGEDPPTGVTPTHQLRELYITYKSGAGTFKRNLKCTVTCGAQGSGKELPAEFTATVSDVCHCGRKPNTDRIVGGEDAIKGEFPWMAGLVTSKTRKPFCGGSIINDRFILTAAHCFKGPYMKKGNIHVVLGGHLMDLTSAHVASGQDEEPDTTPSNYEAVKAEDTRQGSLRFTVEKYFIHPLYVRQTNDFDVAVIKLSPPIDFQKNTHISPICLPDISSYKKTHEGRKGVAAGWGLNSSEALETMGTLQKLQVTVFPFSECKKFFEDRFTHRMMCAGYKEAGKDSCKGDSGGPLISEKKTQVWELIGAVSWGESCALKNAPGVYIRINEVMQWVNYVSNDEDAQWCTE